jgi:hypothetical protein
MRISKEERGRRIVESERGRASRAPETKGYAIMKERERRCIEERRREERRG